MKKLAMAVVAAMGVVCARAEAAVYTLENISYSASNPQNTAGFLDPTAGKSVSLTISDQAVSRGSFNFSYTNDRRVTGDLADFVSVQVPYDGVSFAQLASNQFSPIGSGSFSLAFNQTGAVTAARFAFNGINTDVSFAGTGFLVSGSYSSDYSSVSQCGYQPNLCTFTGQFVNTSAVPEPATWLLLAPVAAFGLVRYRCLAPHKQNQLGL